MWRLDRIADDSPEIRRRIIKTFSRQKIKHLIGRFPVMWILMHTRLLYLQLYIEPSRTDENGLTL